MDILHTPVIFILSQTIFFLWRLKQTVNSGFVDSGLDVWCEKLNIYTWYINNEFRDSLIEPATKYLSIFSTLKDDSTSQRKKIRQQHNST